MIGVISNWFLIITMGKGDNMRYFSRKGKNLFKKHYTILGFIIIMLFAQFE